MAILLSQVVSYALSITTTERAKKLLFMSRFVLQGSAFGGRGLLKPQKRGVVMRIGGKAGANSDTRNANGNVENLLVAREDLAYESP